ncbi:MAG: hypothetical protein PHP08_01545 [Candidatus Dojkabacteria bacterium]|nr:hypothetical protein [Candidatus Dojkabacteria bacterium]
MNRKWNPNWLIFFTIALFVTVLIMFIATYKEQLGLKKCVYGDSQYTAGEIIPGSSQCYCNEKGQVVCDESGSDESLDITQFSNEDLEFSTTFLNFIDTDTTFEEVRFGDVSTVDKGLKVVLERLTVCNTSEEYAPQTGYYMFDGNSLYLTTTTNLLDPRYSENCMVSNTYLIHGLSEASSIYYQSEDGEVLEADICVYGNKVFNEGDAFVGDNGEVVICE